MYNLSYFYQKLFQIPNYSFIVTKNGTIENWAFVNKANVHLIPGSFNPLHGSHRELFLYANKFSKNVLFEISIERVDKGMVTLTELENRLYQFKNYAPVVVSRAPRFIEKIGIYLSHLQNVTFHVGIDCITRMKDDYGQFGIQGLNANFIVYNRILDGEYKNLNSEFGEYIPRNCLQNYIVRSKKSLERSSTEIREK